MRSGTTVLPALVGAVLGFLIVGILGSLLAMATPVLATPLTLAGLAAAAVGAWLGALRANSCAGRS